MEYLEEMLNQLREMKESLKLERRVLHPDFLEELDEDITTLETKLEKYIEGNFDSLEDEFEEDVEDEFDPEEEAVIGDLEDEPVFGGVDSII